jgi:hypothetical protein
VIDVVTLSWRLVARGAVYGASFAPAGFDRIAYAVASSEALEAHVDVHIAAADGSAATQITHDGRSLYPVWGRARSRSTASGCAGRRHRPTRYG